MEESDNADKQGDSTSASEQIPEKGEGNKTPVMKSPAKKSVEQTEPQPDDNPDGQDFNAELPETEDPNAAEIDNPVSITFRAFVSGSDPAEYIDDYESVFSVDPVKGFDGSTTTSGPVEFLVSPKAGWTAASAAAVAYADADATKNFTETFTGGTGKVTITRPEKGYTGDLVVTVTAARVTNTLAANTGFSGARLYGEFGGDLGKNPELNTTPKSLAFAEYFNEGAQPLNIAVPADDAGKNGRVQVSYDSGDTKKDLTRAEGTVEIDETKYVIFPFNPYEVDRDWAETKENTSANYVFYFTNETGEFDLAFDVIDTDYYTIGRVTETQLGGPSNEFNYVVMTDENSAETMDKDTYRTYGSGNNEKPNLFVFKVDPKSAKQVTIAKVYAELWLTSEKDDSEKSAKQTIPAVDLMYDHDSDAKTDKIPCYGIDLSKIDDSLFMNHMTLKIKADTEFIEESEYAKGFKNHTIEFTGDVDTVNIYAKRDSAFEDGGLVSGSALAKYPAKNDDPQIYFAIDPKDGYEISTSTNYNTPGYETRKVVTVSYDKVFEFKYDSNSKTGFVKKSDRVELPVENVPGSGTNPDFWRATLKLYNDSNEGGDLTGAFAADRELAMAQNPGLKQALADAVNDYKAWSLKNVKIAVKTELETENSGQVYVTGIMPDMSYDITGTAITRVGDSDVWNIGEDADLLVMTVNSEMKPTVTYQSKHDNDEGITIWPEAEVTGEGGTYTAKIPVGELDVDAAGKIDAMIQVSKGSKTITVIDGETGSTPFGGDIRVKGPEGAVTNYADKDPYTMAESVVDGSEVTVTLYAKKGSLFDKAYYVFANDKEKTKHDLELNAEKTEATFTVKMTDNVNVFTTTNRTYRYIVKYSQHGDTPEAADAGNGVYVIPAGVTTVTIEAYDGPESSNKQKLYNVRAFDRGAQAACGISIGNIVGTDDHIVTLTLSPKDGELIDLELKGKKTTSGARIDLPSISIRQDKMADEIVIRDDDGNTVDSVTLLPGEDETYTVEVKSGNLDFLNKNIGMEIARDASKPGQYYKETTDAGKMTVEGDNIVAVFDPAKKTLKIAGKDVKKGNDNPVILRFYDVQKRKKAEEGNRLGIIAGSEVSVKLDTPEVALVTPAVTANNTVHNLQLTLSASEVKDDDGVYYRVTIGGGTVKEPKTGANITDGNGNNIVVDGNVAKSRILVENEAQSMPTPYDIEYVSALDAYKERNHAGNSGREIWVKKEGASQEIRIPVYYDYDGENLKEKVQEYSLSVELVKETKASGDYIWKNISTNLIISPAAKLTTKTAEAIYPTDLTLDNTTATVYTGRNDQKIATATFGDVKGVRQLRTTFVNAKTGAAVGGDWTKFNVKGTLDSYADLNGNIYVNAKNMQSNKTLPKDLGLKVSAYAKDAGEISKIITLKFVNGVNTIRFENGTNRVLYRQEGRKATLKIKAVINEESGVKAKNQKLTYALGDANGNAYGEKNYKLSANLQGNVAVNAKNGTVTVSKDYIYKDGDNKFSVIATVAGTDITGTVKVTINQEAQTTGSLVIVDGNGNVIARDGGTISAETFAGKRLYVRALKSGIAQTNNKYGTASNQPAFDYEKSFAEGVSFTSGNKKALTVSKTTGELKMVGAAKNKAVKITAVNTDGSKKVKSTISVTLTGPKSFGIDLITRPEGKWIGATKTYQYNGAMKERFVVQPIIYVNGNATVVPQEYYKNLKITVKNAKKTETKDANGNRRFEIVKSAPVTTVTISDKTDKTVTPVTYTIEQSPATPVKGKALKVKTVTKLTETMLNGARTAAKQEDGKVEITFRITGKDAAAYAGKYIMLTPDYSKKKLFNKIEYTEEFRRANSYFLGGDGSEIVKIEADGTFTLELDMWRREAQERIPGTYKLMAAVGQYGSKGTFEFIDGVKSAAVSVKIPGKAPKKLALETKGDYTLSMAGGEVTLNTGISSAYGWKIANTWNNDGSVNENCAKNAVGSDGKVNSFRDYFYVRWDGPAGVYKLGMKEDIKVAKLDALMKDTEGRDRKGFVTITSYNEAGSVETKDMEINVNLVQTGTLTAKANETYVDSKAAVKICDAEGKELSIYSANLDKNAAAQTGVKSAKVAADKKSIEVEISDKAVDSVSFDLKVLPVGSAYAEADGSTTSDTYLQKYGESVKAEIKLVDPSTAKDTAEVVTKEEDMVFAAVRAKQPYDDDYALAADNQNKKGFNSYFDTGSVKKYVLRVDVKSRIEGAEVSGAELNKTTADKTVQSILTVTKGKKNNEILLTLDQKKFLQECAKEGATVEKGGTITVPVTVKFTNTKISDQTIDLSVKLPSPITYAEAVAAMRAAESEIAGMTPGEYYGTKSSVDSLKERIDEAFRKAVPLDAEAIVSVTPADWLSVKVDGKYEATVLIKEKSTKQDTDYEKKFVWDETSETKWDVKTLMDSIKTLLAPAGGADQGKWLEKEINALESNKAAGKIVDNSYTADDFVNDLTALLKSKMNVELGKNMIIEINNRNNDGFTKKRATKTGAGLITIKLITRDGENKNAYRDYAYSDYTCETKLNISKITNLGDEGTAVKKAIDALDYDQLVYDAFKNGDIRDLEQNLTNAIRAAAEGAIKSKDVTVEFEQFAKAAGDNNTDTTDKVNVAFKLPSGTSNPSDNGYVKFKLLVHVDGVIKDYEIDYSATGKLLTADWESESGETYQRLDQMDVVLVAENSVDEADKLFTWTPATGGASPTLGKAEFVETEKIAITDNWKTETKNRVEKLVKKRVDGMYLTVEASVTDVSKEALASAGKATGTVTITDGKDRSGGVKKYQFTFDMPVFALPADGTKLSELDDPVLVKKSIWDGEIKNWAPTGQPDWDRVSGLEVGKPEKVAANTYKVRLGGTLKYVENWTDFGSGGLESGYYAAISVPIPKALQDIVNDSNQIKYIFRVPEIFTYS